MAKTEVILTHKIEGLGSESDVQTVAAGYARNYLFPRGLAIPVTSGNKRRLEALKKRRKVREVNEFSNAEELAASLKKMILIMEVKTGDDGKLFGSVTPQNIAEELEHQYDVHVDRKRIHINERIRGVGDYDIELHLHARVHSNLKVRVKSTNPVVIEKQEKESLKEKQAASSD
ncbi:MAG TPA: 50S ribosomal protein L9 [Verrucomicrobiales bacterium]|jgi:large subunit ribosomal protein L9|nr:50S ribosomal protein L9 [Verrucomicrobiales bacterium]HIL71099.1 50S ribosomal protein L9 [Verrucomicrobiota bacterium]